MLMKEQRGEGLMLVEEGEEMLVVEGPAKVRKKGRRTYQQLVACAISGRRAGEGEWEARRWAVPREQRRARSAVDVQYIAQSASRTTTQ